MGIRILSISQKKWRTPFGERATQTCLIFTYLGLYLMDGNGQPALLYLVPCTLGVIIILGFARGELKSLWNYGTDSSLSTEPLDSEV
ncbi:signal peptide peptidase-like 5-like [Trifolium medium]|uniref:Signal peptide peptidase-like 5-like n=1 Tax=Trifolium medium TaxID=97028 RepID=A0A392M7F4_9FABA|nr:signal peptide peptidase-like 5-like [Trifolium medium]